MNKQAQKALEHRNWTGLSLAELIEAGRIAKDDASTIKKFVQEANGDAATIAEAMEQMKAADQIAAM